MIPTPALLLPGLIPGLLLLQTSPAQIPPRAVPPGTVLPTQREPTRRLGDETDGAGTRVGGGDPLRLDEVLGRIDATNPRLAGVRQDVLAARGRAQQARGAFDPLLTIDYDTLRYNPSTSPGKAGDTDLTEGIVELPTRSGLSFFGGTRYNRGKVKSPAVATGDLGESFVGLKFPLLRGGGAFNTNAIAERQAALGVPVAERAFDVSRQEVRRAGAGAYWNWVGSGRKLVIARDLFALARERAIGIRLRFDAGDLPEVDAIEADGETERRRGLLIAAERDLRQAAIRLGQYLFTAEGRPNPPAPDAVPPDFPPVIEPAPDLLAQALAVARETRPEFESLRANRESLSLGRDLARAERRARLDFILSPGRDQGVGGIGNTFKAGLFYSVPLRQNAADGRIADAEARLARNDADRIVLEGRVEAEVAAAVAGLEAAYRRVIVAERELALARRLERAERDRFDLGEGTVFLLNQRERARAESESRLIDALVEYHIARADLLAAQGTL